MRALILVLVPMMAFAAFLMFLVKALPVIHAVIARVTP